jgi:hypothetical protein
MMFRHYFQDGRINLSVYRPVNFIKYLLSTQYRIPEWQRPLHLPPWKPQFKRPILLLWYTTVPLTSKQVHSLKDYWVAQPLYSVMKSKCHIITYKLSATMLTNGNSIAKPLTWQCTSRWQVSVNVDISCVATRHKYHKYSIDNRT